MRNRAGLATPSAQERIAWRNTTTANVTWLADYQTYRALRNWKSSRIARLMTILYLHMLTMPPMDIHTHQKISVEQQRRHPMLLFSPHLASL